MIEKATYNLFFIISILCVVFFFFFFFSSRRRHTRWTGDWSSDVCSSDLVAALVRLCDRLILNISIFPRRGNRRIRADAKLHHEARHYAEETGVVIEAALHQIVRSEERRVGKECIYRWARYD